MKYLVYCGLKHHYEKLGALIFFLRKLGHDVIPVYSSNSVNNDPSWLYIDETFVHVNDYLTQEGVQDAIGKVREARNHVEKLKNVPPFWYFHSLNEAALLYAGFKSLIDKEKPDGLLILHANNFFANIFAYVAHKQKVPVIAFQEGVLRHRDQMTMNKQSSAANYCSKLLVWGKSDKKAYVKSGIPPSKITVTGMTHMTGIVTYLEGKKDEIKASLKIDKPIVFFALPTISEYYGDWEKDLVVINNYCFQNGYVLLVKAHPTNNLSGVQNINWVPRNANLHEFIVASDLVLTQASTVGIEALVLKVPIIEVALSGENPESYTNMGICESIYSETDLGKIISTAESGSLTKAARDIVGSTDKNSIMKAVKHIPGALMQ